MDTDYFKTLTETVATALEEDISDVDITAHLIDPEKQAVGEIISRQTAIIAGRPWVDAVFHQIDKALTIEWFVEEGHACAPDQTIVRLTGAARSILTAERTALNFLQTLSGTATTTRRYADLIEHSDTVLLDTRKTLPGLRRAQKYAVAQGGGANHRMGLSDAFLIKENHIAAAGTIGHAVQQARAMFKDRRVEVEVEDLEQFIEALQADPDWIMLDNFDIALMVKAVNLAQKHHANGGRHIHLEASGGIEADEDIVRIAETGVDYISVGALTKHCQSIDLSLLLR